MATKSDVQESITKYPVVLYSRSWCPNCDEVKEALEEENVLAKYIEIDEMEETLKKATQQELKNICGFGEPPILFVDGEFFEPAGFAGVEALRASVKDGEVLKMALRGLLRKLGENENGAETYLAICKIFANVTNQPGIARHRNISRTEAKNLTRVPGTAELLKQTGWLEENGGEFNLPRGDFRRVSQLLLELWKNRNQRGRINPPKQAAAEVPSFGMTCMMPPRPKPNNSDNAGSKAASSSSGGVGGASSGKSFNLPVPDDVRHRMEQRALEREAERQEKRRRAEEEQNSTTPQQKKNQKAEGISTFTLFLIAGFAVFLAYFFFFSSGGSDGPTIPMQTQPMAGVEGPTDAAQFENL